MVSFKEAWQREKNERMMDYEKTKKTGLKNILDSINEFEKLNLNPEIFFFVPSLIWFKDTAKDNKLLFNHEFLKVFEREGRYVFWIASKADV